MDKYTKRARCEAQERLIRNMQSNNFDADAMVRVLIDQFQIGQKQANAIVDRAIPDDDPYWDAMGQPTGEVKSDPNKVIATIEVNTVERVERRYVVQLTEADWDARTENDSGVDLDDKELLVMAEEKVRCGEIHKFTEGNADIDEVTRVEAI